MEKDKDYILEFREPYTDIEKQEFLRHFISDMFKKMPHFAGMVEAAAELHGKPVSIVFSPHGEDDHVPAEAMFQENENSIFINPGEFVNIGFYDTSRECIVNASVAITIGHELFHLQDPDLASLSIREFLSEEDHELYKALLEYIRHEHSKMSSGINLEDGSSVTPDEAPLSNHTIEYMSSHELDKLPLIDLETMYRALQDKIDLGVSNLKVRAEEAATQSEAASQELFQEDVLPPRLHFINGYHFREAEYFWQTDQGIKADGYQADLFEQHRDLYPDKAPWCEEQPDIYLLPNSVTTK